MKPFTLDLRETIPGKLYIITSDFVWLFLFSKHARLLL